MTKRRKEKAAGSGKFSVLYGFRGPDDEDTTGYLRIEDGLSVVPSIWDATLFERENSSGSPDWACPAEWAEYFNSEPDLAPWRFHPVGTNRRKDA